MESTDLKTAQAISRHRGSTPRASKTYLSRLSGTAGIALGVATGPNDAMNGVAPWVHLGQSAYGLAGDLQEVVMEQWNEEQIRAAHARAKMAELQRKDVSPIDEMMDDLKTPKLRDDCPIMYDWDSTSGHCPPEALCGWAADLDNSSTNVRALIPEDTVMEWIDVCFTHRDMALYCHEFRGPMQAKIDAYKYGGPDE